MNVLIAEEKVVVRRILGTLVQGIPGSRIVGEARDARETLLGLLNLPCDVLIMDLRLPGGRGLRLLEGVRQLQPDIILLVVMNDPEEVLKQRSIESGADEYFDQSTGFLKLRELLRRLSPFFPSDSLFTRSLQQYRGSASVQH